jgi:GTPase SAR1 family protein
MADTKNESGVTEAQGTKKELEGFKIPSFVHRERYTFSFAFKVVGEHHAGKASLMARFIDDYTPSLSHTEYLGYKHAKLGRNVIKINFTSCYYTRSTATFIIFDLTKPSSFVYAQTKLKEERGETDILVLVGNKLDCPRRVLYEVALFTARDYNAIYFELSSRDYYTVRNMFETIAEDVFEQLLQGKVSPSSIGVTVGCYPIIKYNLCERLRRVVGNIRTFTDVAVFCIQKL